MATESQRWLALCPRGVPALLARELSQFGATELNEAEASVSFLGSRAVMYRACLWSRLASRILMPVGQGFAADADELYATVLALPWPELLAEGAKIAVVFNGSNPQIRNTRFGAQRCKDAVLDAYRAAALPPPAVDPAAPDISIVVRLQGKKIDVALDMVGESLHRRGYRQAAGDAPLKEHLAAAVLMRGGWCDPENGFDALIDPMCGSGTLLLEGAMIAADQAPGLGRRQFGFMHWAGHDELQWQMIVKDAEGRATRGLEQQLPEIRGFVADPRVIRMAQANIAAAGLQALVRVSVKAIDEVVQPTHVVLEKGLVVCNPPYGQRLGKNDDLAPLFQSLGRCLHDQFKGWSGAILAGEEAHGRALGLRSHKQYKLFNGQLPVLLLMLDLSNNRLHDSAALATGRAPDVAGKGFKSATESASPWKSASAEPEDAGPLSAGGEMFANRIRKNQRRLKSWIKRTGETCYRLYDADMPEYAVAVDRYDDWLHVSEYKAPAQVSEEAADARLDEVRRALPVATGVPSQRIVFKQRARQKGKAQYQRQSRRNDFMEVREGQVKLLVNLHDYLDTGLFLDHRPLRKRLHDEARDKRFLNLFCYTGAATIHAAMGGAASTTSVDLSNAYLAWLERNLSLNELTGKRHTIVRADVLHWLRDGDSQFDVIFLDPPSFSNSAKMLGTFDVQRDHAGLIKLAMTRLAADGRLYFSNNRKKFRLDEALGAAFTCRDITKATLDPDFVRPSAPHSCWEIRHLECP
ncbi:MAG: bifunctional 23S rRNA (guanine(2069)-N(7))-methyltransferase RlmK/23S rRNA (guanine(2445)-N(2))-methyltransferase RlmL [Congregibacter sp.]